MCAKGLKKEPRRGPGLRSNTRLDTLSDLFNREHELARGRDIAGVGVGAAGFVDAGRSTVLFAPNLAWRDEPLRVELERRIDAHVKRYARKLELEPVFNDPGHYRAIFFPTATGAYTFHVTGEIEGRAVIVHADPEPIDQLAPAYTATINQYLRSELQNRSESVAYREVI